MRKLFKTLSLMLALAVLLGCCAMLGGCGDGKGEDTQPSTSQPDTEPGETAYSVTVTDYDGNPFSDGTVVVFYRDGQQAAMQRCDANGVATKTMKTGEYTFEVQFTGNGNYWFSTEGLKLTGENPAQSVVLYKTAQVYTEYPYTYYDEDAEASVTEFGTVALYVTKTEDDPDGTEVQELETGCTYVELTGEMNYFLFVPEQGGTYEFTVIDGDGCKIASCGNVNYIRDPFTNADTVEEIYTASIENTAATGDLTNTLRMVIGIQNPNGLDSCFVHIERVGDPGWTVSQEEWIIYKTTVELTQCVVPEGTTLKNFDLTQSYDLVLNTEDGFYHMDTADGPLVYAYLTADPRFVDCFQTILEEGTVRAYFWDETGEHNKENFIKKEAYGSCLKEYFEYVDTDYGVYPLTEDLAYIIQSYGNHTGWWDASDANNFIIQVDGLNADSAWLFMCCYAE